MKIEHGILAVDVETKSAANLRKVGQWAYSLDESTDVYCVVFGYAESVGRYTFTEWTPGDELPRGVLEFVAAGGTVVAHNASFELSIWRNILEPRYGFPPLDTDQLEDTQIRALALNLPMSLGGLAGVLGCPTQKDQQGHDLMMKMSRLVAVEDRVWRPRDRFGVDHDTLKNRERLMEYCRVDVGTTLDCYYRLKPLDVSEMLVYLEDKRINTRGIFLDRPFSEACIDIVTRRKKELDDQISHDLIDLRCTILDDAINPHALKTFLKSHGVEIPSRTRKVKGTATLRKTETTDKAAVLEILSRDGLHADVRTVLENRLESAKATSLTKLIRVGQMVGNDGRLRFSLQYGGAHTGRWTSHGLQVHNLPKDKLGPLAEPVRRAIMARDLNTLKFLVDRPLEAVSWSLRSMLCAAPGKDLIAADWSAIEARVVAWLAGQVDVLAVFARGEDIYVKAAADVGSKNRQLGKVCTLALGYGMGVLTFITTASGYGIVLNPKEARRIQQSWREANCAIVGFWGALEGAARLAISDPGVVYDAGRVKAVATKGCLGLTLPSGRTLRYWKPSVVMAKRTITVVDDEGVIEEKEIEREEIRFFTMGSDKSSMVEEATYGGKLVENVTQAVARDLLAAATVRVGRVEPYEVVMHVHDSLAAEVPEGEGDVDEFCAMLSKTPLWARGLPLAAEGYRSRHFRG